MNKLITLFFLLFISPVYGLDYDYTSVTNVPIRMSIVKEISTKSPIAEGQEVEFRVLNDVEYNGASHQSHKYQCCCCYFLHY